MSKLSERLGRGFVYTSEIAPPKGADLRGFRKELEELKKIKGKLSGVNVVDIPGSILLMSSLGGSIMVKQAGLEPVYQVACRDRNVLALEADLLTASAYGIRNILAITGDHPRCKSSDHPGAKPVYDLDSTSLLCCMQEMNQGRDLAGNKLYGGTNFYPGAALTHTASPWEGEIHKTRKKLEAGARFFQTQAVFDVGELKRFLDEYERQHGEDIHGKVIAGLVALYDAGIIEFLESIPNVIIPSEIKNRIINSGNSFQESIHLILEQIDELRDEGLAGAHIMTAGNAKVLMEVFREIK
ncbi:MAG: 5,10-methylenetetrahydrofolate reductase [Candidatus Altiarchaeales archaeon ex4484_2]|nr:MAG: 5,10-methylenetetrahydrofolate reductase [Candidatus Altiarchaeales archaeon ex4484_2]